MHLDADHTRRDFTQSFSSSSSLLPTHQLPRLRYDAIGRRPTVTLAEVARLALHAERSFYDGVPYDPVYSHITAPT